MTEFWLIWSNEHKAWWGRDKRGYVQSVAHAGRYSYEDACQIVENAAVPIEKRAWYPFETMVPAEIFDDYRACGTCDDNREVEIMETEAGADVPGGSMTVGSGRYEPCPECANETHG